MSRVYPYRRRSPASALAVLGGAALLAALLPDPSARLLALLAGTGPLWWLISEALRRRRAVRLDETGVVVEQPLPPFSRAVPYDRIAGVLRGEPAALAYRQPRRAAHARPRLGLVMFEPVEEADDFWGTLLARAPAPLAFTEAQVRRFVRGQRLRRAAYGVAALLAVPFVVIALARVIALLV